MKKTYLTSAIYILYGALSLLFNIFVILICILGIIYGRNNPTIYINYIILPIFAILFIFLFVLFGKTFFQWVIIDEKQIIARNIFGVIQKIAWEDVVEIRIAKFEFGSPGAPAKWLFFYDGTEKYQRNGLITKEGYITIRYSERKCLFLRTLKPEVKWL